MACSYVWGEVINVPADVSGIQAGIAMASNGDTVLVAEGTYYENINFKGKAITVSSLFIMDGDTSHISKTIIDGSKPVNPDSASVVFFESGEDTTSILCGFTITGGTGTRFRYENIDIATGGGILVFDSGAKILNNRIKNNIINEVDRYNYGGGIEIWCTVDKPLVMEHCEISHNSVYADWGGGGGVELSSEGYLRFKNNFVHHNLFKSQRAGHGGGILLLGAQDGLKGRIEIINNIITHNEAQGQNQDSWGGGIYSEFPNLHMYNNIIAENKAYRGGGFCILTLSGWADMARARMINNTIVNNDAGIAGSIWNRQSDVIVLNSILWNPAAKNEIDGLSAVNLDVHYSDVNGGWPGTKNISYDPKFTDSSYKLSDASRCIGAGASSMMVDGNTYLAPSTDFAGNIRPNPAGSNPDLGAFENERAYPDIKTVLYVPAEFTTIQEAINAAMDGDTVLVDEGTYFENINYNGKAITVASLYFTDGDTSHISKTIINGSKPVHPDSASVVRFMSGEDTTSILCGFTITGGSGTKVTYNDTEFSGGGGIMIFNAGGKIIHNKIVHNTITQNEMYAYSGAIDATGLKNTPMYIADNEMAYNTVNAKWGGGGACGIVSNGPVLFTRNHVHHNKFISAGTCARRRIGFSRGELRFYGPDRGFAKYHNG